MHQLLKYLAAVAACTLLLAAASFAQSTKGATESSVPPTDSKKAAAGGVLPLPALATLGKGIFIRPLTDVSQASKGGFTVLPRIGHINITVDDGTRHEMVVLFNLPPGPHKVVLELADSSQKVVSSEIVEFTLPDHKQP